MNPDVYVCAMEGKATCYIARTLTGTEATDADAQNAARLGAHAVDAAMAERHDTPSEPATVYCLQVDPKHERWAIYVQVLGQKPAGSL